MPTLHQTLRTTDLDFLQRIAGSWHVEVASQEFNEALSELEKKLNDAQLFREVIESLPQPARNAWDALLASKGRLSWAIFSRDYGELRQFGLAKRVRENPDQNPVSAVEMLWYRGLVGRAFLNLNREPQEYAYIPDEFLAFSTPAQSSTLKNMLRPATPEEIKVHSGASDAILDDSTELLATLRMNRLLENSNVPQKPAYIAFLLSLLTNAKLLNVDQSPNPDTIKDFLSQERGQAMLFLFDSWQKNPRINDLRMLPGIICEGEWTNDPLIPRMLLFNLLHSLDANTWWSLPSLLAQVKKDSPDFQRPAGDYDSWFIRDEKTQNPLRGFSNWEKVDGALLRYLLAGPLHWLGLVDIARADKGSMPLAFKLSSIGTTLLDHEPPRLPRREEGSITALADGTLLIPRDVPRPLRYQILRFCVPVSGQKNPDKYQVNAESLASAQTQGLRPSQLNLLLNQAKVKNIPQPLLEALERWEKYGVEIRFETGSLLRLEKPELLPLIQKNPRINRCLSEILNNKVVLIKPGFEEALRKELAQMGLLAEIFSNKDV